MKTEEETKQGGEKEVVKNVTDEMTFIRMLVLLAWAVIALGTYKGECIYGEREALTYLICVAGFCQCGVFYAFIVLFCFVSVVSRC